MAISRATWVPPDPMPSLGHRVPHLPDAVRVAVLAVQVDHHVDQDRFRPQGVGDRPATVGVVAARGDLHVVLGEHPADRLDPETFPVPVDVGADHLSRRSSSAAAKNAPDVRRISLARRSSPTSRRNRTSSVCSSLVVPGRTPASISVRSIQPRNVSEFTSINAPIYGGTGSPTHRDASADGPGTSSPPGRGSPGHTCGVQA